MPLDDPSYFNWLKTTDGVTTPTSTYATSDSVDEALARIPALGEPWLTVVSFNAVHSPYHKPPEALTPSLPDAIGRPDRRIAARAMTEALDTEIGRLMGGLDAELLARTVIIFLSDNGTSKEVIEPPWDPTRGKLTLYDGGCRVPMAITGPIIDTPGLQTDALVHVVDLFPTIAALARVEPETVLDDAGAPVQLDGVSLMPVLLDPTARVRETVYVERFMDNGAPPARLLDNRMIRDARYKYMESFNGEFFFFEYDPSRPWTEGEDLIPAGLTPEQQRAREHLERIMEAKVATMEASWD
jgi:arylsulfatase A-like enzyme